MAHQTAQSQYIHDNFLQNMIDRHRSILKRKFSNFGDIVITDSIWRKCHLRFSFQWIGCVLWIQSLTCALPSCLLCYIPFRVIVDRIITKPIYIKGTTPSWLNVKTATTPRNITLQYMASCLNGKLWYRQHTCVGDTLVYTKDSGIVDILRMSCLFLVALQS